MAQIVSGTFLEWWQGKERTRRALLWPCSFFPGERYVARPDLSTGRGDRQGVSGGINNTPTSAPHLSPAQERRPEPTLQQLRHRHHGQALAPVSRPAPLCPLFLWTPKGRGAADCSPAPTSTGGCGLQQLGQVPFDRAEAGGTWRPAPNRWESLRGDLLTRALFQPWGPSRPAVPRSLCASPHVCPLERGLDFCIRPDGKHLASVGSARSVSIAQLLHRGEKAAPDRTHTRGHGCAPVGLSLRNQTVVWAGFL